MLILKTLLKIIMMIKINRFKTDESGDKEILATAFLKFQKILSSVCFA